VRKERIQRRKWDPEVLSKLNDQVLVYADQYACVCYVSNGLLCDTYDGEPVENITHYAEINEPREEKA
jgi:hypothetical protein